MSKVLVIDINKKPQNPIHPAQARQLLRNKKAAIFRQYPFVIILTEKLPETTIKPLRIKIDPGSRVTGLALIEEDTCLESKQEIVKEIRKHFGTTSYNQTIQELSIKFSNDGDEEHLDNQIEEIFESFVVNQGKKIGTHIGRVAIRSSGSFNISTVKGLVEGISYKYCEIIHRKDGYGYHNLVTKLSSKIQLDIL